MQNQVDELFQFSEKKEGLLKEFFSFFKNLEPTQLRKKPFYIKLLNVLRIVLIVIPLASIIGIIQNFFYTSVGLQVAENSVLTEYLAKDMVLFLLIFSSIWAPISEELAFRLWLKPSPYRISIGLSMFIYFLSSTSINNEQFTLLDPIIEQMGSDYQIFSFILLPLIFLLCGVVIGSLVKIISIIVSNNKNSKIQINIHDNDNSEIVENSTDNIENSKDKLKKQKSYYLISIIVSSLFFGFIHIANFNQLETLLPFILIITLPQIILGFVLAFIRLNYGFIYSVVTHLLYNFILVFPVFILYTFFSEEYINAINTGDYTNYEELILSDSLVLLFIALVSIILIILYIISIVQMLIEYFHYKKVNKNAYKSTK